MQKNKTKTKTNFLLPNKAIKPIKDTPKYSSESVEVKNNNNNRIIIIIIILLISRNQFFPFCLGENNYAI